MQSIYFSLLWWYFVRQTFFILLHKKYNFSVWSRNRKKIFKFNFILNFQESDIFINFSWKAFCAFLYLLVFLKNNQFALFFRKPKYNWEILRRKKAKTSSIIDWTKRFGNPVKNRVVILKSIYNLLYSSPINKILPSIIFLILFDWRIKMVKHSTIELLEESRSSSILFISFNFEVYEVYDFLICLNIFFYRVVCTWSIPGKYSSILKLFSAKKNN